MVCARAAAFEEPVAMSSTSRASMIVPTPTVSAFFGTFAEHQIELRDAEVQRRLRRQLCLGDSCAGTITFLMSLSKNLVKSCWTRETDNIYR
jgi:hypothetical protein